MLKFFITIIVSALIVGGLVEVGAQFDWFKQPTFYLPTLIFLTFSTSVIFVYLHQAKHSGYFLQLYLTTMVLKMLAYLAFCWVIISKDKVSAGGNVVFFMVTYFVFTGIEIVFLYARITGKKQP